MSLQSVETILATNYLTSISCFHDKKRSAKVGYFSSSFSSLRTELFFGVFYFVVCKEDTAVQKVNQGGQ